MPARSFSKYFLPAALLVVAIAIPKTIHAQDKPLTKLDREGAHLMLAQVEDDLKKRYYDRNFHGMDIDARFREAAKKVEAAATVNQTLSIVAATLVDLNDSHTYFIPPPRPYIHDYGLKFRFIGDKGAFVVAVRPGSDAEKKGVKLGDQLVYLNDYAVNRDNFWKMEYVYWSLRPQPSLHLSLKTPDGKEREVDVDAYMRPTKKVMDLSQAGNDFWQIVRDGQLDDDAGRPQRWEDGKGLLVLKLANFMLEPEQIGTLVGQIRSHSTVVIDLRSNPGGYADALEQFVGAFFDHEVKISDRIGRKELKPSLAKPHGRAYTGKLIVLVDSKSASCSELFARVMQLQNRATVIGDRSSGMVMETRIYPHHVGVETVLPYAVGITEADMIMSDGRSLEHAGVIPDTTMLPTAEELATGRDPVLAYAVQQAGGELTPEEAGKLFPAEWKRH